MDNTNDKDHLTKKHYLTNVNHEVNNQFIFVASTITLCAFILVIVLWVIYTLLKRFNLEWIIKEYNIKGVMGLILTISVIIMFANNIVSAIQWTWINKLKKKFGEKQFKNFKNVRASYIMNTGWLIAFAIMIVGLVGIKDYDPNETENDISLITIIFFILATLYFIISIIAGFALALKHLHKKNPVLEEVE